MTREEKIKNRPPHNGINRGITIEDQNKKIGATSIAFPIDYSKLFRFWQNDPKWTDYAPLMEMQKGAEDWMDCTCEAITNAIHLLDNLFGNDIKKSVRFLAKNSGVTRDGNSTATVDACVNSAGMVNEDIWPRDWSMNWNTYYQPIPQDRRNIGKDWANNNELKVFIVGDDHDGIMKALDYGPCAVIGYAWAKDSDGLYHDFGYPPNHRFLLVSYEKGVKWIVYDSYPDDFQQDGNETKQEFIKELAWDYDFGEIKLVVTSLKSKKKTYLTLLAKSMQNFYYYWDGKHNFYYIAVPFGETKQFRQQIILDSHNTNENFLFIALKGNMNQSSWAEVSKFPDVLNINKKFA